MENKNDILYCLYIGKGLNKKYFGLHKIKNTWTPNIFGDDKNNAYHFLLEGAKDVAGDLKCNIERII